MQSNTLTPEALMVADAMEGRVASAIIDAIRAAHAEGVGRPTPALCIDAAKRHRAKARLVCAANGWLRCEHCHEWIDAGYEPVDSDVTDCPHVGEADTADVYSALMLWVAVGAPMNCSHSMPRLVAERMKTATAHQSPEPLQSRAASSQGDALAL